MSESLRDGFVVERKRLKGSGMPSAMVTDKALGSTTLYTNNKEALRSFSNARPLDEFPAFLGRKKMSRCDDPKCPHCSDGQLLATKRCAITRRLRDAAPREPASGRDGET